MNLYRTEIYFEKEHNERSYQGYIIAAENMQGVLDTIEKEWVGAHVEAIHLLATGNNGSTSIFLPE